MGMVAQVGPGESEHIRLALESAIDGLRSQVRTTRTLRDGTTSERYRAAYDNLMAAYRRQLRTLLHVRSAGRRNHAAMERHYAAVLRDLLAEVPCGAIVEADWDGGHWSPVRCGAASVDTANERCARHLDGAA